MSTLLKMTIIVLLALAFSCSKSDNAAEYSSTDAYAPETEEAYDDQEADESEQPPKSQIPDAPIQRRIIKTGRLEMQVKDVNESTQKVEQLTDQFEGFIGNSQLSSSNYRKGSSFTIRVPAEHFDALLDALSAEAIFLNNRSIEAQDVTQEYLDVEIRLQTKKDVRDRYIDILRNKAKTVQDVLLAEEQIRVIQEEIESAEGRLKYLKDRTALGTIHLNIYQEIDYRPEPSALRDGFWHRVGRGFENGWDGLVGFLVLLVNMWPLMLLIFALLLWKGKWLGGIFRRKSE